MPKTIEESRYDSHKSINVMYRRTCELLLVLAVAVTLAKGSSESTETTHTRSMYYVCPPDFIRLGSSCYYFSTRAQGWQEAHFECKDRDSNLTAPERWEDRNLRKHLNDQGVKYDRWIGGIYDWNDKVWKWGGEMKNMDYQSFKKMPYRTPESLMFHCVAMVSDLAFRWDAFGCYEKKYFICQTKLRKVRKTERNFLREKWNPNGNGHKPNEITVPRIDILDNEIPNNPDDTTNKLLVHHKNDISKNRNRYKNPNSINGNNYIRDQANGNGKTPLSLVSRPGKNSTRVANNRRRKPFPGFRRNRLNPEQAYLHNVNALKSGKTGLSNNQIEKHLRRLERMRKREQMNLRRREEEREKQNALNSNDPNKLATKGDYIRSRDIIKPKKGSKGKKKADKSKSSHSMERITQKTYLVDNQISELHPKTIVEVHSLSEE